MKSKMNNNPKIQYKHYIKIQSKVHNQIYHTVMIDLYCHEKMPKEKTLNMKKNKK